MSNKVTCPGCESYTSAVFQAVHEGEPCPYCGLPASTIAEVNAVREARGDEQLREKLAEALTRAGRAEAEVARLRDMARSVRAAIDAVGP